MYGCNHPDMIQRTLQASYLCSRNRGRTGIRGTLETRAWLGEGQARRTVKIGMACDVLTISTDRTPAATNSVVRKTAECRQLRGGTQSGADGEEHVVLHFPDAASLTA